MGAMFSSYTAVNNSYNQVTDRAQVSRSSRDIIGMIVRDIRLAGFKYYFGKNDEGIANFEDLTHVSGNEEDRTIDDSHDPIIVFRDRLGYTPSDETLAGTGDSESKWQGLKNKCCDQIRIVYGDFIKVKIKITRNIELHILQGQCKKMKTINFMASTKQKKAG